MNWFMSLADDHGNPIGQRVCITDSVLDTAGDMTVCDCSEQESAAQALTESAYGQKDRFSLRGIYWLE
jgi:hypothetical protein